MEILLAAVIFQSGPTDIHEACVLWLANMLNKANFISFFNSGGRFSGLFISLADWVLYITLQFVCLYCNYVEWWGKHLSNICSLIGYKCFQYLEFVLLSQLQCNQCGLGDSELYWPWWNGPNPYSSCSVIRASSFSTAVLQTTLVTAMRDEPGSYSAAASRHPITL